MLEEASTPLYAEILTHLVRTVRFLEKKAMGESQFLTLLISF